MKASEYKYFYILTMTINNIINRKALEKGEIKEYFPF